VIGRAALVMLVAQLASCAGRRELKPIDVVPFTVTGKLMFVPVRINGASAGSFCIDSGATHSVIDPRLASRLGLKMLSQGTTTGAGRGDVPLANLEPVTLTIGGVAVEVARPYAIDLSGVPIPATTLGLVGFEAFAQYVIRVDPVNRTLSFFDAASFTYAGGGARVPLVVEENKLFIDATLDVKPGLRVVHRLRIDLGSEDSVNDEIVAQARETRQTSLGTGLGTTFTGWSGVFDAVQMGPYVIRHVWGPGAPHPTIGMEMFRRFIATFDASRGVLYLEPTAALGEPVPAPAP